MAYIDRDKLIENKFKNDISYNAFVNLVKRQPTADVAERKRGKWIKAKPRSGKVGIVCSSCGNEAYWDSDYGQQLFDYCPYCGSNNGEESDNGRPD